MRKPSGVKNSVEFKMVKNLHYTYRMTGESSVLWQESMSFELGEFILKIKQAYIQRSEKARQEKKKIKTRCLKPGKHGKRSLMHYKTYNNLILD